MKIVKGNLLDAGQTFIAHGCNCQGVMGSGVAAVVREKWPTVFQEYVDLCAEFEADERDELLGFSQIVNISETQSVVNMFTQNQFGQGKQARYTAIVAAFEALVQESYDAEKIEVAIPYKFASDRGGLNWDFVVELLEELEEKYIGLEITAYQLEE